MQNWRTVNTKKMDSEMVVDESIDSLRMKNNKKSWVELWQDVRTVRRQLSNISSKVPNCFSFKKMSDESGRHFCRIYFLSTVSSGRETTLLYCDVPLDTVNDSSRTFLWHSLLESSFQTFQPQGRFSREEQFQLERKRVGNWGLTSYDFQACGRFVFPACSSVFFCDDDDDGFQVPPYFPHELKSCSERARLNPLMCPYNSDLVAYVHNSDLWVYHIGSLCDARLTYVRKGNDLSENPVSAGIPPYVTQEEFNRYIGYWWRPVALPDSNTYCILYEEVDECDVEILRLPCYSDEKELEEYRFPRAGTSNAKSTLKIVQFTVTSSKQIESIQHYELNEPIETVTSAFEYLVRAGWTPDGKHVWTKVLDRKQCYEQLVLIPFSCFVPSPGCDVMMQVIYDEKSDIWINVHDVLHFFSQENDREIKFLWASEETGFRHLYVITVKLCLNSDSVMACCSLGLHGSNKYTNRIRKKVALTSGSWEVSEHDVWVNESKNLVYFVALKDTPIERHLYVIDLEKPEEPLRLTPLGYSHTIAINSDYSLFVSIQSNVSQAPFGQVYQLQYPQICPNKVKAISLGYFLEPSGVHANYTHPELFNYQLQSGQLIYGLLFKPKDMQPGKKYPTVLTIYGGPEIQLVTNTFKGMRSLRQYLLASAGYVVIAVDCRGSRHRGLEFESHIKGRMGTVEIADHVEVLQWLVESTGIIDVHRIAVHGWSYGGYLSLMGLAQRPDIFKVAIAGAPVTSWHLYDTGYTERYMDTPMKNEHGYSTGSVLSYIQQFPDEENRLLIIHGMMDENVHFRHTTQLINALVKAGKPYHLKVYPTERHSLRHLDTSEHYETSLLSFLQQYL